MREHNLWNYVIGDNGRQRKQRETRETMREHICFLNILIVMFLLIFSIERKESGITMASQNPMLKRYVAAMVMGGVGDSLGYYRGSWEFNFHGTEIQIFSDST